MIIYDNNGKVLLDIEVDDTSFRYKAIKGENSLTLKFSLEEHIEVPIGSYCEFKGDVYSLMLPEDLTLHHRRDFEYALVMYSDDAKAKRYMFVNPVDGRLKFPLTAKPKEHLQMFVDNMNKRDSGWEVGECPDEVEIALSYNHNYCYDALVQLADALELDYWFEYTEGRKVVHIGKLEIHKTDPLPLSYGGDGQGLKPNIKRTNYADALPIEILYIQGSSTNIDPSKYKVDDKPVSELHMPLSYTIGFDGTYFDGEDGYDSTKARIYKTDSAGLSVRRADKDVVNHSEDSLDCSDITATREEVVKGVWHVDREKHYFDIAFESDVDYSKYQIGGEIPTIVFQKGMLAGKEFDIATDKSGNILFSDEQGMWRMEIVPQEIDGIIMPDEDSGYVPEEGDTFKFFGIQLPSEYLAEAEMNVLRYAIKHLYTNEETQYTISGELDEIYAKKKWDAIRDRLTVGNFISFSDKSFQEEPLLIRIIGVKEFVNKPYSPVLEISNASLASSLISAVNRIENDEVKVDVVAEKQKQYTKRTYAQVRETMDMVSKALEGFEPGINPVTLETMAILVGSQTLQFKFIKSLEDTTKHTPAFAYDETTGIFSVPQSYLMHYTIGQNEITTSQNDASKRKWEIQAYESEALTDGSKAYYLYANVPDEGVGTFELSLVPKDFKVDGGYNLLVGVLNTEYEGTRSFVPLYGYTEVLPGQITTDVIRSADGNTFFDLVNGVISGKIHFEAGSTGVENLDIKVGGQNLLRNSAFTGDYLSETLTDEAVLEAASQMYSAPLDHWDGTANVSVVEEEESASGYAARMPYNGILVQPLYQKTIAEENYVLSFRAKGEATVTAIIGGVTSTIEIDSADAYKRYVVSFVAAEGTHQFVLRTNAEILLCEPQLERGTVATAWGYSWLDNNSDRAYWQSMKYLQSAMAGSTTMAGGLVLTNLIQLGSQSNNSEFVEKAGVSGLYNNDDSLAFWAGGTMAQAIALVKAYSDNAGAELSDAQAAALAKFAVTHGGRGIFNDVIVRGTVYATDGIFSGFVKSKITEINSDTQTRYLTTSPWYSNPYIDIQKAGGYLKVTSPLDYVIALWGTRYTTDMQQVEQIRSMVGSKCTIVNATDEDLLITGDTGRDGAYFSTKLDPYEVMYFECKAIADANGDEQIYWEQGTRAKVKSTF